MALLEMLLEHFKQVAKVRGENTVLYDNPNATSLGDPELMRELTKYLELNPYYPLPEGYKKVEEKCLLDNYTLPSYFTLPESVKIAVELVDELMLKALEMHALEPITTYEYHLRVVPTIGKVYQRDPAEKRFMLPLNKVPRKGVLEPVKHPISLKQLNTEEIRPSLSAVMKLEIAKAPLPLKGLVAEVSNVVAEIVQAVEDNRLTIGHRMKWGPSAAANGAMKGRLERRKAEEQEREEKEKQRKLRAAMLKGLVEEAKREKERKSQEEGEQR
jgi:hypothetical protein